MYLSDETWEKIKPAIKQGLGIVFAFILLKWFKCPLLRSICMRDDFGDLMLKCLQRRMELENSIYNRWLLNVHGSYKK